MKRKNKLTAAILTFALALTPVNLVFGHNFYDHAYGDIDGRIVYLSDKDEPALITPEKFYVFSSKGTLVYDTDIPCDEVKAMFADDASAFYLTGETNGDHVTYYLHKISRDGKRKSGKMEFPPKLRETDPDYTDSFTPYNTKYSFYKNYVMFETVPQTESGIKSPLHFGFARNSLASILNLEEDVGIKVIPQPPVQHHGGSTPSGGGGGGKGSRSDYDPQVSSSLNIGGYDSVHYTSYLYDYALKDSSGVSLLFPQVYADGSLIHQIQNNNSSGLFICENEYPESTGDPLPKYTNPRLVVESYDNDSLVTGDIYDYRNGIIAVGKDANANSQGFKNAFVAFYDLDVNKGKKCFITDYTPKDGINVSTPYIKVYKGKTYIFRYETKEDKTVLKYGKLNKNAELENVCVIDDKDIIPAEPMIREDLLYYIVQKDGQYSIARKNFK